MIYGDGGVGKTTLTVDLGFHLAAGDDWLGIPVPRRVRVLLVENEGPRPLFRRKLERKREGWTGSEIGDRLRVLENPWGRFSFAIQEWRQTLAEQIREEEIDVLIVGPVTSSGLDVAGTMTELRDFISLVDQVRDLSGRPIAILLVHHENKGGKVSGAWEGIGDTLLHVQAQGHGKLRLYIQKARWSSEQHATALHLAWADGDGFTVEDKPELDDAEVAEMIVAAIGVDPGGGWSKVEQATRGVGDDKRRQLRDGLLRDGVIVNVGKDENGSDVLLDHCPPKKRSRLYLAADPTIVHLRQKPAADPPQSAAAGGEGATEHLRPAAGSIEPQAAAPQLDTPMSLLPNESNEAAT